MQFPGARILTALSLLALPVVALGDLGSVAIVKLSIDGDAHEAGRAAVSEINSVRRPSPLYAAVAYEAASSVAELHRQTVDEDTFAIYADGAVELTVRRTAPTFLFKRIPGLRDFADASATTTVERVYY